MSLCKWVYQTFVETISGNTRKRPPPNKIPNHTGLANLRDIQVGNQATLSLMSNPESNVQIVRKRYKSTSSGMAVSEANIIWGLDHQNIIKLIGLQQGEEYVDLWLPVCDKDLYTDLEESINDPYFFHPASISSRLQILISLLDAVKYIHTEGVVHRDIKPENVLLDGGRPLLIDFGFSEKLGKKMRVTGGLGSQLYAAPEILSYANDPCSYDGRAADVYAMGATMWVVIFGQPPWTTDRTNQYRTKDFDSNVTNSLWDIIGLIKLMTHVNPLVRPTAVESLNRLTACVKRYDLAGSAGDAV